MGNHVVRRCLAALTATWIVAGCAALGAGQGATLDPHLDSAQPLGTPEPDPAMPVQICGVQGVIDMAFLVPPDKQYDDLVPALTGATELDGAHGALVMFYDGPATMVYLTGIPGASREPTQTGLVCVVTKSGEPNVYSGIDREGVSPPPDSLVTGPINDETICQHFTDAPICKPMDVPAIEATPRPESLGSPTLRAPSTEPPTEPSAILLATLEPGYENCELTGLPGLRLHGDPEDPLVVWAQQPHSTLKIPTQWPTGASAQFTPELQVAAADGSKIAGEGDAIPEGLPDGYLACTTVRVVRIWLPQP